MKKTEEEKNDARESGCINSIEELNRRIKEIYETATWNHDVAGRYLASCDHFIAKNNRELIEQIVNCMSYVDGEKRKEYYKILKEVKQNKDVIFVEVRKNEVYYYNAKSVYDSILERLYLDDEVSDDLMRKVEDKDVDNNFFDEPEEI